MPATACPNSRIAAVICSGVRTRAVGDDGAGAEGAIAPKDASTPNAGAPDVWGSSADEDAGGSGWVCGGGGWEELGGGPDMIEPESSDTRLIGTRSLPRIRHRL
jgi:hypothetical protein